MILITSGAHVSADLQPEFGAIPAALVPVANQPLYLHQARELRSSLGEEDIYISLPNDFVLSSHHANEMQKINIQIVRVATGLDLRSSILSSLMSLDRLEGPIRILHGDTLISPVPDGLDLIATSDTQDDYPWEVETNNEDSEIVWCGYFSFSNPYELVRALVLTESFVGAVKRYDQVCVLDRLRIDSWEDYGHANTYFRARQTHTTERSFNSITVAEGVLIKTGTPAEKITAEAKWFENLPIDLKPFAPAYYGRHLLPDNRVAYNIEFLLSLPLNESYVHSVNHPAKWEQVFDSIDKWFKCATQYDQVDIGFKKQFRDDMVSDKSWMRFREFSSMNSIDLDACNWYDGERLPSYNDILNALIEKTRKIDFVSGYFHGDLCFSNIIFDSRSNQIKLIDPRGKLFDPLSVAGETDIEKPALMVGDLIYDTAKLSHSVIGMYDFVIAGAFDITGFGTEDQKITFPVMDDISIVQESYLTREFSGQIRTRDSLPMMCLLFFSMLPLHSDRPDRQKALLLNGLRCFKEYVLEMK